MFLFQSIFVRKRFLDILWTLGKTHY